MAKENTNKYDSIQQISYGDSRYSAMLMMIGQSAPKVLYCMGNVSLLNQKSAAVVGARKATPYGKWAAYNIGRKLAENGIVTVSGMAYGCDAEAHRGALDAGGPTIAVLGSGVSVCYPKRNRSLYDSILEHDGLLVSEHPADTPPLPPYFAERNRIISGLSSVVIVTEAGVSSGSLITAEFAAEQGRTVMALPGNMNSTASLGCNKLIQDGSAIVVSFTDILQELGVHADLNREQDYHHLSEKEQRVLEKIQQCSEIGINQLGKETGLRIAEVNSLLAALEIRGFVVTSAGKVYIAK